MRWNLPFSGISGQDNATGFLKRALVTGRIAHAYIFYGTPGVGRKKTARAFAAALACARPAADGRPCGTCRPCVGLRSGHPDLLMVGPDESGEIAIDEVRHAIRAIGLKPYEAKRRVVIVDGADRMSGEAESAFLKTLEEPSPNTVIILIAARLEALLPTVVSRAQAVRFSSLGNTLVRDLLMTAHGVEAARAAVLAGLAGGSIGEALRLSASDTFFADRATLFGYLGAGSLAGCDLAALDRDKAAALLALMLGWYRDCLVVQAGLTEPSFLVNGDYAEAIGRDAARFNGRQLDGVIRKIIETGIYLEQNANVKLAMGALTSAIANG